MSDRTNQDVSLAELRQKQFLGHPIGLWALFTTEMWERFCYYGMRALLVLYLISTLTDSNPGFGWTEFEANKLYGWFTGLVYLTPLFGGYLADRYLGQHRSVLLGGILMAAGEFCLFFSEYFRQHATTTITMENAPGALLSFMFGLLLITVGNGFFKPCISVMVGGLYEKDDPRRDDAFSIFYMGINVGAFLAPFVAGSIGEKISWHWGFLTAGIGMLFGLCTYSLLRPKYLGSIGKLVKKTPEVPSSGDSSSETETSKKEVKQSLSKIERDRIAVILTLTFFCIAFWSVFEQAGTSLNIFAKKETNRHVPTAVAEKLPGFLPNQDELDAKIAIKELREDLVAANRSLEKLTESEDIADSIRSSILSGEFDAVDQLLESRADHIAEEARRDFDDAMDELEGTYESAKQAIGKANEARRIAEREELDFAVNFGDLTGLLQEGEEYQAQIDADIQKEYSERIAAFQEADSSVQESVLNEARNSVLKRAQKAFLDAETGKIDKENSIWTFPTTWYQSVNAFVVVLFVPIFNMMWGFLRRRNLEPSTPIKFGVGLIFLSVAFLFMIFGALQSVQTQGNAGAYWLLLTYTFCTFGELCLSPVGLSMVSRLAPPRFASLLMGVWFLSSAVAGYLSGYLAAVLGSGDSGSGRIAFFFGSEKGLADFFLIMTLAPFIAGVIVFCLAPKLRKMMHEHE